MLYFSFYVIHNHMFNIQKRHQYLATFNTIKYNSCWIITMLWVYWVYCLYDGNYSSVRFFLSVAIMYINILASSDSTYNYTHTGHKQGFVHHGVIPLSLFSRKARELMIWSIFDRMSAVCCLVASLHSLFRAAMPSFRVSCTRLYTASIVWGSEKRWWFTISISISVVLGH